MTERLLQQNPLSMLHKPTSWRRDCYSGTPSPCYTNHTDDGKTVTAERPLHATQIILMTERLLQQKASPCYTNYTDDGKTVTAERPLHATQNILMTERLLHQRLARRPTLSRRNFTNINITAQLP